MDFLNLNADDFIAQSQQKVRVTDESIYDPDVTKAKDQIYKSVIRFIPWHAATNVDQLRYKKYYVKLVNPITNERIFLDDPSTAGKSSVFWNIDTILRGLEKSEPEVAKEIKKTFVRSYKYFSLVYIKKDPQNPALEGMIKIFPYGHTIWAMGEQLLNPEDAELGTATKINPFDLLNGRDFVFVAKKKNAQWRDFTSCKFMNESTPLVVKTAKGNDVAFAADDTTKGKFVEYLKKNSPDLSQHFFKEWTEEDYKKAVEFLRAAVPYTAILDEAFSKCRDEKIKGYYNNMPVTAVAAKPTTAPKSTSLDELSDDISFTSKPEVTAKAEVAPLVNTVPSSMEEDIFADL